MADDRSVSVLRLTVEDPSLLDGRSVTLNVVSGGEELRFPALELATDIPKASVEFLVPATALGGEFTFESDDVRCPVSAPLTQPDPGADRSTTVHTALLAQHDQLIDQTRRIAALRAEVRTHRSRTAAAKDELEDVRVHFAGTLLDSRNDMLRVTERLNELQDTLARTIRQLEEERARRQSLDQDLLNTRNSSADLATRLQEELDAARAGEAEATALNERARAQAAAPEADLKTSQATLAASEEQAQRLGTKVGEARASLEEAEAMTGGDAIARAEARAVAAEEQVGRLQSALAELRERTDASSVRADARVEAIAQKLKVARAELAEAVTGAAVGDADTQSDEPSAPAGIPATDKPFEAVARLAAAFELRARGPSAIPASEAGGTRPWVSADKAGRGRPKSNAEAARLVALNMARHGAPRADTARYLADHFGQDEQESLLDEVYQRATE